MGFSKVLKQPVRNIQNTWKYALKRTRCLIPIFIVSFGLYEHVWSSSLEKRKTNFHRLYSWSSLCCHYRISNILLHHQIFLPRNPEISVTWLLLKSMLKQMWAQGWRGKQKQMGSILLRYQPSVTCNSRTTLKSTLILLKLWTNGSGSKEQFVILSDLFFNDHGNNIYKF